VNANLLSTLQTLRTCNLRAMRGRSESFPGNCLSKTQLPANTQVDV